MQLSDATARAISASLTRVCQRNPFLATLALWARFQASEEIPTAATDGRDIFVNEAFIAALTPPEHDALLLHEVLHAALLHVPRRAGRDPKLWNVAADIVVNGMLVAEGYQLPAGGLRDETREHLGVEEVYELLIRERERPQQPDSGAGGADGDGGNADGEQPADLLGERPADATPPDAGSAAENRAAAERHWKQALQQAQIIAKSSLAGSVPAGIARELAGASGPQLDWRTLLWRYVARTPTDFQSFDRRFIGGRMYLETLEGESVRVAVAVDTSGSIDGGALEVFFGELRGILRSYPHLVCDLFYADAELHGPFRVTPRSALPRPIGGGGTDFRPFFAHLARRGDALAPTVAVYLTDGYGSFPDRAPPIPTLWVVPPDGRELHMFPFGVAVRLLQHAANR